MEPYLTQLQEFLSTYGLKAAGALIILVLGYVAAKIIKRIVKKLLRKSNADETLISFLASLTYFLLMAFVLIATLSKLGIPTASFIAVLGAAGLAIGLALQGSLSNFASGVLLIAFKPFKAGDYIEGAGVAGTVKNIDIFTTILQTPDNKKIIVPNGKILSDNITNYSAHDTRRLDLVIGVGYEDDLAKVKNVLTDILDKDDKILKEPAPIIAVLEMADSSINFAVRPWVKTVDYWDVYFRVMQTIKERFDAEGISIPFPQRDVHIIQEPETRQ